MRKLMSICIIVLILALSVNQVVSESFALAGYTNPYDEFWRILEREAELVVELNKTRDGEIAKQLIENSRLGAENAANISALIWMSIQELKKSGVKLYYTEEELRKMAYEIKEYGLPQETVKALKEQGWSDAEIKALERYIAQNADKIEGDFDMEEFLVNMSRAFVDVGFKYNEYERWALEVWLWKVQDRPPKPTKDKEINPVLSLTWVNFYSAYAKGDIEAQLSWITKLRDKMVDVLTTVYVEPRPPKGESPVLRIEGGRARVLQAKYKGVTAYIRGGGVKFNMAEYTILPNRIVEKSYYWPHALRAYELASEIRTILLAMNLGNGDKRLEGILNEKVSELHSALVVYKLSERSIGQPYRGFIRLPIKTLPLRTGTQSLGIDQRILLKALIPEEDEGKLIVAIEAVPTKTTESYVKYKLKIKLEAENNAVRNLKIKVSGDGLEYSKEIDILYPEDGGKIVETNASKAIYDDDHDGIVKVEGKVEISYIPVCGKAINSKSFTPDSAPLGCDKEKTIVERYSEDFEVEKQEIDMNKIELSIYPSPEHPKTFQDVTFYVTITNDNDKEISGKCTVYIALPEGTGRYSKDVIVPASSSKTFEIAKVRYGKPGTYGYSGVFKFGQFEVSASGSVTVSQDSSGSSGSLKIRQVTFEPSLPKVQDNVKVGVKVSNSYSSKKTVKVELVVDGKTVNQVEGVVSGGKEREFILSWTPTGAGEYGWIVYLYEKSANNVYLKKDSKSGRIEVTRINSPFSVRLYAYPTELEGGGEVTFLVKVWNYNSDRVSLKGFVSDGDGAIVKNIDWTVIPANAQNYTVTTFTLTVYGVGEHKYKLFLDNYDGKPNGKGEEHWDEVRVEVRPMNGTELKQVGFECNDPEFHWEDIEYKAMLVCRAFIYNPAQEAVSLNSVSVKEWHTDNSEFMSSLDSSWTVEYPEVIQGSKTATIVFKNTAHTGLITLEKDLFGAHVLISLRYVISPQNGNDIIFTGTDTVNIKQDNKDVTVDVGTNLALIGLDVKAGITIIRLVRSRETMKALKSAWPYVVSFFRWAWPKLDS
ncbi:hypothetical protein [Pyrococcus kukulkanii]|uniref:CARDB domain-containing protein n=1 Tax=Pyrococcus kukulkanii TaxID=1609559 RepID=A0ABV4T1Y6_9EURY